jgi:hypothetical protein
VFFSVVTDIGMVLTIVAANVETAVVMPSSLVPVAGNVTTAVAFLITVVVLKKVLVITSVTTETSSAVTVAIWASAMAPRAQVGLN